MKNIHLLPTDKPSRLHLGNSGLVLCDLNYNSSTINAQHIYITSDEEIKDGWKGYAYKEDVIGKVFKHFYTTNEWYKDAKKIILTTDPDLIKDGVQAIDDDFLEWFVKNPSCEEVEVERGYLHLTGWVKSQEEAPKNLIRYKIIIPKEEPKQETLSEAALKYSSEPQYFGKESGFRAGAKWQQERMYSEEDMEKAFKVGFSNGFASDVLSTEKLQKEKERLFCEWFEQFKKK